MHFHRVTDVRREVLRAVEFRELVFLFLQQILATLRDDPRPHLAAVDGAALGAGTQLAVACDLRVATPAARFGVPAAY